MNQNNAENSRQTNDKTIMIDLGELFFRLFEKLPVIIAAAIIGGLVLTLYSILWYQPKYRTVAKIYLADTENKEVISYSDLQLGNTLAIDYLRIFEMKPLKEIAKEHLGEEHQDALLGASVSPSNPTGTHLIYVTVSSASPENAQLVANAYAEAACDFIEKRMMIPRPTILEEASLVTAPYSTSRPVNVALGIVGGALLAVIFFSVVFIFDDRIKGSEEISNYFDLPCLGVVALNDPREAEKRSKKRNKKMKNHHTEK